MRRTQHYTAHSPVVGFLASALLTLGGCGGSGSTSGLTGPGSTVASISFAADSLAADSLPIVPGDTMQVTATALDASGHPVPGVTLVWTSADTTVATVSATGLVTAVDLGDAEVDVSVAGAAARVVGLAAGLDAMTTESAHMGSAHVSARSGGRPHFRVHVVPRIVITPLTPQSIDVSGSVTYAAHAEDAHHNQPSYWKVGAPSWQSSNPVIASVTAQGVATGVSDGTTKITATVVVTGRHVNGSYSSAPAKLTVTLCGGITAVTSWSVKSFDIVYKPAPYTILAATYAIDNAEGATGGTLTVAHHGPDSTTWAGAVTGGFSVANNLSVHPAGGQALVTTESGSGPLGSGSEMELQVTRGQSGGCVYKITLYDPFIYTSHSPGAGDVPTKGGAVTAVFGDAPSPPGPGVQWQLDNGSSKYTVPAAADPLLTPLTGGYYEPSTALSAILANLEKTTATTGWTLVSNP